MAPARAQAIDHDGHLARHHIHLCLGGAAIGHAGHHQPVTDLEILHEQMVDRAGAGIGVIPSIRLGLHPRDQPWHVLEGGGGVHHPDQRRGHGHRDRRQILHRVERHIAIDRGVDGDGADMAEEHHMAIGGAALHLGHADIAIGAGAVVHHHGLAEQFGEARRHEPGIGVIAAGGAGHDDAHRPARPGRLGLRQGWHGDGRGHGGAPREPNGHVILPFRHGVWPRRLSAYRAITCGAGQADDLAD